MPPEKAWKCYLCWKVNDEDATQCACCRRDKAYAPKSLIDSSKAKPLALHGVNTATHPFREDQIATLVGAGLNLAGCDTNGWTALHSAARLGQDIVVHNILQNVTGEDRRHVVEAASAGGWRALHHAIAGGHLCAVEELLVADADVNARLAESTESLTPLHLAAQLGHVRIVDLLLQCGADPSLTTKHLGQTALHLAINGGPHIETIRLLCARTELVSMYDFQGLTPLQQAMILPADTPGRRETIATLETSLRERGASEPRLLPAFLSATVASIRR